MSRIAGPALRTLQNVMGLVGSSGATEFDDAHVSSVLDLQPIVRRSLTPAGTEGIFFGQFLMVHAGAGNQDEDVDPYGGTGTGLYIQAYPDPVPAGADLWLLGASATVTAGGAADFDHAGVSLEYPITAVGIGVRSDTGAAYSAASRLWLGFWEAATEMAGIIICQDNRGMSYLPMGVRLRRGCSLHCYSSANAAAQIQVSLLLGLFPEGLGQDVAQ